MIIINQFSKTNSNKLNLCIALLKDEYEFSLVGVLKNEKRILEYCHTIKFIDFKFVKGLYEKLRFYQVFPNHFYDVIDDK